MVTRSEEDLIRAIDKEKSRIVEEIQALFERIFKEAPLTGEYKYEEHPGYKNLVQVIKKERPYLLGVYVCRSLGSHSWFPIYHWSFIHREKNLIPQGADNYAFIQSY